MARQPEDLLKCYDIARQGLDELFLLVPGANDATRNATITQRLVAMSGGYRTIATNNGIDHDGETAQFAYVFKYLGFHANLVYHLIRDSPDLAALFEKEAIEISAIGGGPGTDILGVLKFIHHMELRTSVYAHLMDRELAWNATWRRLRTKVPAGMILRGQFVVFDILDRASWIQKTNYLGADLFLLVKVMSEVYRQKQEAEAFFEHLFRNAKSGSHFLFADNGHSYFANWFDELAGNAGLEVVKEGNEVFSAFHIDRYDRSHLLADYRTTFDVDYARPQEQAKIVYRVARKV